MALVALASLVWLFVAFRRLAPQLEAAASQGPALLRDTLLTQLLLNPWYYAVFIPVLLLEGFVPADPDSPAGRRAWARTSSGCPSSWPFTRSCCLCTWRCSATSS